MTTPRAKDPCPCGSGKRYKHCHMSQERSKAKNSFWLFVVPAFVVLVVGIALWARQSSTPAGGASQARVGASADGVTGGSMEASANQDPLPGGRAPVGWEFDEANDRHWNPDHGHWHEGPPPPPELQISETSSEANPSVPNPEPWQYDAASNQHYDPAHAHWHSGPPPPPSQRTAATVSTQARPAQGNPNIPNPEPWQYDPLSNRHYDPRHGHWHSGPPPANRDS